MSWQSLFGQKTSSGDDMAHMQSAIEILKENVRGGSFDGLKEYHGRVSQTVFINSLVALGIKLYIAAEISEALSRNREKRQRKRPRAIVMSDSDSDDAAAASSHVASRSKLPPKSELPKEQAPRKRAKLQKQRSKLFEEAMQETEASDGYGLICVLNKEKWTHSVQLNKYMGRFDSTIPLILELMKSLKNHDPLGEALQALVDALNESKFLENLDDCEVYEEKYRDVMSIEDMHFIVSSEDQLGRDTQNAYLLHIHAPGEVTLLYSNKRDLTVPDGDGYLTLPGMTVAEIQKMLKQFSK